MNDLRTSLGKGTYGEVFQSEDFKQRVEKEYIKPVDEVAITYTFEFINKILPESLLNNNSLVNKIDSTYIFNLEGVSSFELKSLILNIADEGLFTKGMPVEHITFLLSRILNLDMDLDYELLVEIHIVLDKIKEYLIGAYFASLNRPESEAMLHSFDIKFEKSPEGKYLIILESEKWSEAKSQSLDTLISVKPDSTKRKLILKKMLDIANAIDLMNVEGIAHLDVKPENIFFRNYQNIPDSSSDEYYEGELVLGDFGIASVIDTRWNDLIEKKVGTVNYIAPEAIYAKHLPRRKFDVYSLSITLFELLAGTLPEQHSATEPISIKGDTLPSDEDINSQFATKPFKFSNLKIEQIDVDRIQRNLNLTPEKAKSVVEILCIGAAVSPEDRYNTCKELVQKLIDTCK